ncbi:hypothetical protein PFAG_04162 [Plasmodium falciparum Santa Lucia]|uniref:Uncharacterized protein n=13 Tax=Plasmodium falciparum TaxID=5833 RepID=Q8I4V0_PLAF7|nr:conserved Plasmodium protein, unknown function [Plasmodium falciparum 3D7]ETW29808.1 hypothetical protein PFFCH_02775 [Plasmodium falciparum FCH/4]ETW35169.1 hypothetical protein PFTANZ_04132 [Plasmodium falciparum Tanzania (2000708)]ETW41332.1 hypothetical protein PFNF135_04317 [Plasmodium falciparum NF135/5.C10]ETW47911.1 hypothetical protein PFMALIP_04032 [Plasmodium falciparum MaliPS096_E11]ETW57301.1 hypothetical protein PFUGPA_00790 [Plasmodium falciparum Palo Alto/Uganda]ETW59955.1 |eukprot:XP_001350868.1 conserved Plasmodium protein, unknown function [Plasmodium falciparum 3D7]
MKKLSDFYTYSKDKSISVFNFKKKEEEKKKKEETGWMKKVYLDFEKTKNDTYTYVSIKTHQMKDKFMKWNLRFFKVNHSKYEHFPWYKRLYYIMKDYIYNILKIKEEGMDTYGGQISPNEKKISRLTSTFENFDFKNRYAQKQSEDSMIYKYRENLKKEKMNDSYLSERSQSEITRRNLSNEIVSMKGCESKLYEEMYYNNKNDDNKNDDNKNDDDDNNNNYKNRLRNLMSIGNMTNEKVYSENESKVTHSNTVDKNENYHFLNIENSPKFNIKNTWEKLSGYIS